MQKANEETDKVVAKSNTTQKADEGTDKVLAMSSPTQKAHEEKRSTLWFAKRPAHWVASAVVCVACCVYASHDFVSFFEPDAVELDCSDAASRPAECSTLENFLFIGNPGTGKSTLINGMIGRPVFKSGTSVTGSGVTYKFDKRAISGKGIFMDTPGLSDETLRQAAAKSITAALKQGGFYKIIFVLTEEAGRVRPDDKVTMELVLNATSQITSFSVVVNKVEKKWLKKLDKDPKGREDWITKLMAGLPVISRSVYFMESDSRLDGNDDVRYRSPQGLADFIRNAPGMKISSQYVADVKADKFEEERKKHASDLARLEKNAALLAEAAEKQKEQMQSQIADLKKQSEAEKAQFNKKFADLTSKSEKEKQNIEARLSHVQSQSEEERRKTEQELRQSRKENEDALAKSRQHAEEAADKHRQHQAQLERQIQVLQSETNARRNDPRRRRRRRRQEYITERHTSFIFLR